MSQYDMNIIYICGEDNTVADALSRVAPEAFASEQLHAPHETWAAPVSAVLQIATDTSVLQEIKDGYMSDPFCAKFIVAKAPTLGIHKANGLWYVGSRLLIPQVGDIRENLFRLAHDAAGHFGADKSYASLRHEYYWLNMRKEPEEAYVPGCEDCQWNKSPMGDPRARFTCYQSQIDEGSRSPWISSAHYQKTKGMIVY
jgi:hypothetical protein